MFLLRYSLLVSFALTKHESFAQSNIGGATSHGVKKILFAIHTFVKIYLRLSAGHFRHDIMASLITTPPKKRTVPMEVLALGKSPLTINSPLH